MAARLSYYDILGVVAGASAGDVQRGYEAKAAVLAPRMISGAPSKVIAVADRARAVLELARRTLTDPALREGYDTEIGIIQPASGLARPVSPPSEGLWGWDPSWNRGGGVDPQGMGTDALGLIADWLAPRPARPRHVAVPDARGLFVGPARLLVGGHDLRVEVVQLTRDPMPVEGLVVDQSPRSGVNARRWSTITVQVWHPARQRGPSG